MTTQSTKAKLRTQLRARRNALTPDQQRIASKELLASFLNQGWPKPEHVAVYLASDGELDLTDLIQFFWQQNVKTYLPVIHASLPTMQFNLYSKTSTLEANRFGILEPKGNNVIDPQTLDLVLTPLVGFDESGGRLGMGGGYYDRTFEHYETWTHSPRLIGVAHECQKTNSLPMEHWDISLEGIVTNSSFYQA